MENSKMTYDNPNMTNNKSNTVTFLLIPYEDIICEQIFPLLTLKDLINVQDVNETLNSIVTWSLENNCKYINF